MVAFVSNGSFIDGNTADGIRKTFMDEFATIYVYNLRGNQRTSGETSRREGGKIFGSGSRAQIAICILVKKAGHEGSAVLKYRDIGDYLSREEKLDILSAEGSIAGTAWEEIVPNASGDWINQRDERYDEFQPIGDKATKGKPDTPGIFQNYSLGLNTNRDAWVYNFSRSSLEENVSRMIENFNHQYANGIKNLDPTHISWSSSLESTYKRKVQIYFDRNQIVSALYRPFAKQLIYFDQFLNHRQGQLPKLFPTPNHPNLAIALSIVKGKEFSSLVIDSLPDLHLIGDAQIFALYSYEPLPEGELPLDADGEIVGDYVRRENITDATLTSYREYYENPSITKEDIFYYIYALLHHPEYREQYKSDLAKMLPRVPKVEGFAEYSRIGRELAELHLNYEDVAPYTVEEKLSGDLPENEVAQYDFFAVEKMRFGPKKDKSIIVFNQNVTLSGIPEAAYEYQVNGRSAIEWIIESYQVKTHKASQITNDPNDYSREVGNPRYILDLLKRIITVSLETQKLVDALPTLEIAE